MATVKGWRDGGRDWYDSPYRLYVEDGKVVLEHVTMGSKLHFDKDQGVDLVTGLAHQLNLLMKGDGDGGKV